MSVYPRNLSNFLNRMSGYNKNSIKMNVLGAGTANAGDVVQVDLPSNSIVDLSSLAWSLDVAYTGAAGTAAGNGVTGAVTYPINAESVISRLAVEVNGQTLVNLTNYNILYNAMLYMTATEDYQLQRRVSQSNTEGGGAQNGTCLQEASATGAAVSDSRSHVIDTWLGFLGSAKPNFIDTSLLGNVRISITLAGADIIGTHGAATSVFARSYTVQNQAFSVDVISISDGVYDAMVDQMLAQGAPIEIPFKNYFSYTGDIATGSVPFNVATQSLDRLWGLNRLLTYNTQDANDKQIVVPEAVVTVDTIVHTPAFFTYTANGHENFHFQVNNTLYPQWTSARPVDWWQHTKLALGDQGNMLAGSCVNSIAAYRTNFFTYCCQLEHRTDGDERFLSGIDTRGSSAQCYFKASGAAAAAAQTVVFAECTSSLRIFANKVLEIVV